MGKPSRLRRNRLRMTLFNLAKSNQRNAVIQNTIENLYAQLSRLKEEIKFLNEKLRIANIKEPTTSTDRYPPNEDIPTTLDKYPFPLNSSSDLTMPSIELKPDLFESKEATLEPNHNLVTADFFIKYMNERDAVRDVVSLADIT